MNVRRAVTARRQPIGGVKVPIDTEHKVSGRVERSDYRSPVGRSVPNTHDQSRPAATLRQLKGWGDEAE